MHVTPSLICLIVAAILFAIAAIRETNTPISLTPLGLFFLTLAQILG